MIAVIVWTVSCPPKVCLYSCSSWLAFSQINANETSIYLGYPWCQVPEAITVWWCENKSSKFFMQIMTIFMTCHSKPLFHDSHFAPSFCDSILHHHFVTHALYFAYHFLTQSCNILWLNILYHHFAAHILHNLFLTLSWNILWLIFYHHLVTHI